MTTTDHDLAAMVQALEQSGEYRVLRRLPFRQQFSTPTELTKVGILLDVETTGLDTASDEVVELGMVKFSYHPDGTVAAVLDTFSSFNEPSRAIPEEAIKLHGITNEMAAAVESMAMPSPLSFPMQLLSSPITQPLTANLPKGIGRYLRSSLGPARSTKSNGALTDLKDHGLAICSAASGCFTGYIVPSTTAMPCWKFWRIPFLMPIVPHYHCCLRTRAEKQFGSGLNKPRSTSKTS